MARSTGSIRPDEVSPGRTAKEPQKMSTQKQTLALSSFSLEKCVWLRRPIPGYTQAWRIKHKMWGISVSCSFGRAQICSLVSCLTWTWRRGEKEPVIKIYPQGWVACASWGFCAARLWFLLALKIARMLAGIKNRKSNDPHKWYFPNGNIPHI